MRSSGKLALLAALLGCFAMTGKAYGKKYGMAGCGLGSIVMGKSGGQVSAATTNGTFLSQGFGITSGTSNCKTPKQMAVIMKQEEFLMANMMTLQKEMARGDGETLQAFVQILGCQQNDVQAAGKTLVNAYDKIFRSPGVSGVLDAAKDELRNRSVACRDLG